jgi:hypothetical protein
MKLKLIETLTFLCFVSMNALSITKDTYQLSDLNVDIAISIDNMGVPDLEYTKSIANTTANDPNRLPNFNATPLNVLHGSILKLKIDMIDKLRKKTDVTNDKYITVNVAGSYVAHLCKKTEVCVWPAKPNESSNRDQRFGTATVEVLYFTPGGKSIGQNVFQIKVSSNPNGHSINPPSIEK